LNNTNLWGFAPIVNKVRRKWKEVSVFSMATAKLPHGIAQDMMVLNLNIKQKFLCFSFNATHNKKQTIHDLKPKLRRFLNDQCSLHQT
jgi:hypothetical protein